MKVAVFTSFVAVTECLRRSIFSFQGFTVTSLGDEEPMMSLCVSEVEM